MIEWVSVFSSEIRKIGYDSTVKKMYIDFEDSEPYYTYSDVPQNLYHQFVSASSVGHFYHQYIKDKFETQQ